MQQKFFELHATKRISSISRLRISRKKKKLIAIYKKIHLSTVVRYKKTWKDFALNVRSRFRIILNVSQTKFIKDVMESVQIHLVNLFVL